jgi:adenylosuccinate lyase
MTATSFDVISSALAARDREVMLYLVLPALKKLEQILIQIAIREASTVQIGRTHGQHAVPITFGFMIAGYVSRLGRSILKLEQLTGELHAKFSGAVGSYNASSLILDDPEEFEREILAELGVKPAECATQIAPHEEIVRLLNELTLVAGIMDDMANDLRQLQRTEISEVGEEFAEGQVGSSTMPQKRNPVNLEKVCSIFKIVMPRILTAYLNIRSEHQRDLTGSAAERTNGEMFAYVMEMTNTLIKVLKNLRVDRNNLKRNLNLQNGLVLAEPLYIIMAFLGHPDAHEVVRKLTLLAQKEKLTLTEAMTFEEELLRPYIEKMSEYQKQLLSDPDMYIGKAKEKAINVALRWNEQFGFDIVTV